MIKTFKGNLAPGDAMEIRLSRNDGLTGYKIAKFQLMPTNPGGGNFEYVSQVFATPHDASATVDFNDPTILAVALWHTANSYEVHFDKEAIFDDKIFNQDITITMADAAGGTTVCNYYLELEEMKLDLSEATVATLRDMRGRE